MPSTRVDVPFGVWTEILPASATAFATNESGLRFKFVRAGAAPTDLTRDGSMVTEGDIVPASSVEPTFATPKDRPRTDSATPWVIAHTE